MMTEMKIPFQVRNDPAWVNVKAESKVPFQSGKYKAASPSDINTWSDFETALNSLYSGKYDGIGYCFHDNGLVGIDIDAGFDEDGFLSDLAVDIINACKSYTEYSRSGRGVHILVKGDLPWNGANNRAGVEIYKTGRYFIMTGKQLLHDAIAENQAGIDYVINTYFADFNSKVGTKSAEDCTKLPWKSANFAHLPDSRCAIYQPVRKFKNGKMVTEFPPIAEGCRNISLTSYAGQLSAMGLSAEDIYKKLCKVNEVACNEPLDDRELQSIVKSIMRYER